MRIFLVILLILLMIPALLFPLRVVVNVQFRDQTLWWHLSVCGIRILPRSKPSEDQKKSGTSFGLHGRRKSGKPEKEQEERAERTKLFADRIWTSMQQMAERTDTVGNLLFALPKPLRTLCKGISICKIETDFRIADEDAAACAILYGGVQAGVQNLLAGLGRLFRVRRKSVRICCDFTADTCRWDCGFEVRARIGSVLSALLYFWLAYQKDIRCTERTMQQAKL